MSKLKAHHTCRECGKKDFGTYETATTWEDVNLCQDCADKAAPSETGEHCEGCGASVGKSCLDLEDCKIVKEKPTHKEPCDCAERIGSKLPAELLNSKKNELITNQQLEISRLKEDEKFNNEYFDWLHTQFYAVGAPLNDDQLGFNKEQLEFLFKIAHSIPETSNDEDS